MKPDLKKTYLFLGLTFLICWSLAILFFAFGGKPNTFAYYIVLTDYMLIPMVMTIVIQKFIYKERLREPMGISLKVNRWWLVAWLLPPIIAFATFGVSLLLPGVKYSPTMEGMFERMQSFITAEQVQTMRVSFSTMSVHPIWIGLVNGLFAGISINAVAGFGEELGWRGFLQKEFSFLGFWKSSLLIGAIWGVWHTPLILKGHNYYQHPVIGVLLMICWCILLAPILSYIRLKAKSVIAAAICHGTLNATYGLSIMMIQGGNDLTVGITGLAGFIVLAITNLALYGFDTYLSEEPIMKTATSSVLPQTY
ncbi:MAG: abortive infection protein [Elusimicrobia bacterium RIFOXYA2_FULL_40_6]|nr:MAG: abortive infection protein [Elusimicrobia bacterium RIFOXYA2_FULL_40_6]